MLKEVLNLTYLVMTNLKNVWNAFWQLWVAEMQKRNWEIKSQRRKTKVPPEANRSVNLGLSNQESIELLYI